MHSRVALHTNERIEAMFIRKHRGAAVTGALGTVVIFAHLVAAVGFGMVAAQWISGAAIGLILVLGSVIHIVVANHGRKSDQQPYVKK